MISVSYKQRFLLWVAIAVQFLLPGVGTSNEPVLADTPELVLVSIGNLNSKSIDQLIQQLGHPDYYLRRRAEEELLRRGADVFDQLQQVQDHSDLEIAVRATHILQKIHVEWVRPDDPAEVQPLLQRFGQLTADQRQQRIDRLAALEDEQGLGALCRIARFEPSLQLARYAALRALNLDVSPEQTNSSVKTMLEELGASRRVPVRWLNAFVQQLQNGAQPLEPWIELIDEEIILLREDSPDTSKQLVTDLVGHHLSLCSVSTEPGRVFEGLRRLIEVSSEGDAEMVPELTAAYYWVWKNKHWEVARLLEENYQSQIEGDRLLLYMSSAILWKQGDEQAAQQGADRAYDIRDDDTLRRTEIGRRVGELGRYDWAEREWRHVVDKATVLQSADARSWLAIYRYHDRGDNQEAADLMVELCDAIEADPKIRSQSESLKLLFFQRDYFRACQAADEGDYPLQRKLLDSALSNEQLDADVLIAMYRSPGADEAYRKKTLRRIEEVAKKLEAHIKEQPDYAHHYNHWAWLISNTEGDYDKAVRYSQRSLELRPDEPSYLDTLGRCYYASGELEKAIEVQRQAVSLNPHLQVMRDQLELFETQLTKSRQR